MTHLKTWLLAATLAGGAVVSTRAQVAPSAAEASAYAGLFAAAHKGDLPAIRQLIAARVDPNTRDPKGQVGLTLALQAGTLKAFHALMQARNLQVEARNAEDGPGDDMDETERD